MDCTTLCGKPGWWEMHSLLRRDQAVAFGIFYLLLDQPHSVQWNYGVRLDVPALTPRDQVLVADWTAP